MVKGSLKWMQDYDPGRQASPEACEESSSAH
jgi:hypothetical protein